MPNVPEGFSSWYASNTVSWENYITRAGQPRTPRTPRWLWVRTPRGEWRLIQHYETIIESHRAISSHRRAYPTRLYKLTKTPHPPRSIDTPETKDPFA